MDIPKTVFKKGAQIDRYKLIKPLGSGGTAEVWEVEDSNFNKWALKIYSPGRGMDEIGLRLFKQQFLLTSNLNHSSILKGELLGEFENTPYIVFKLCESSVMKRLQERVHARRTIRVTEAPIFSEPEIAKILSDVGKGLNYLHENNICHRDIKPDNILILNDKIKGEKYLISDFGVSADIKQTILRESQTISESNIGLTPDYAAPEQFQGIELPSSDIFSLGITIYELCVGTPPIKSLTMSTGVALLNGGSIPDLPPYYSYRLNQIVKSCLKLLPEERATPEKLIEWSDFYINEGYWPEIKPVNRHKNFKYLNLFQKIINILLLLITAFALTYHFSKMSDKASIVNKCIEQNNLQEAQKIFKELDAEQKLKINTKYYEILNSENIKITKIINGTYSIASIEGNKYGIIKDSYIIAVPFEYDEILPFKSEEVITVSSGGICKWININNNVLKISKNKVCNNYESLEEFTKNENDEN